MRFSCQLLQIPRLSQAQCPRAQTHPPLSEKLETGENRTHFLKKMERYEYESRDIEIYMAGKCADAESCVVSCSKPFLLQGDGDELLDGEDTMKDLRTTFAGIFGEKK